MDDDDTYDVISEDNPEVRLGYSSSHNISFRGMVETGISRRQWDDMDQAEKDQIIEESVWDLIDIYELNDDEPDVY